MAANGFLAVTGGGIARAVCDAGGRWVVHQLLAGQHVRRLAADPARAGVIYAGTHGAGVLRSRDGGASWQTAGLDGRIVTALAVSHAESGLVFAGTRPALLFISRDGGDSWHELGAFRTIPHRRWWFSPAEKPFTAYVQGIAPSPVDPDTVVVGIEAGATVRTADGGATWSRHLAGALRDCHSLAFHPTNGAWIYEAGGTGAGAACSRDGGQTWHQPRLGLDRHYGWACAADAVEPEVWYVSVSTSALRAHRDGNAHAAIFRTRGHAWERLAGGLPDPLDTMPYSLLTDPETPGAVYAGLADGEVWHSADYGEAWERLPVRLGGIRRVLLRL